jgi:Flp pilus assembly protein TadD
VVAPDHLIDGGTEISWADRRHRIMTLDFTSLYDDGLHVGLSEEEFGASLDGLYANDFAFDLWQQLPIEQLAAVVGRFPQSRALRSYLWRIARAQDRRDLLGVLDRAARALGDDTTAEELLKAGEAAFAAGDAVSAAESFAAAAALMPTSATVWNDLAVTAHHLGRPNARAHIEQALFLAPDEPETLLNRSAIRLAGGDRAGARADATRVIELDPENPGARQLLAQVLG